MPATAQPTQAERPSFCSHCNLRVYHGEELSQLEGEWLHEWCARTKLYRAERELNDLMFRIERTEASPSRRAIFKWFGNPALLPARR